MAVENDDIDEEIFITLNCFSQDSLFPDFGHDILDKMSNSELSEAHNQHVCEIDLEGKKKIELKYSKVNRDIQLVNDEELEERKLTRIPENTKANTNRAVLAWSK